MKKQSGWNNLCIEDIIPEDLMEKYFDYFDLWYLCDTQKLSNTFILRHKDDGLYWDKICKNRTFNEKDLDELKDVIVWSEINIPEKLWNKYKDYLNWDNICRTQKLSEEIIDKYQNNFDWSLVCRYQKLSERFLIRMKEHVDWNIVCKYQKISENFAVEMQKYINWTNYIACNSVSEDIIGKCLKYINVNDLKGKYTSVFIQQCVDKQHEMKIVVTPLQIEDKDYFVL